MYNKIKEQIKKLDIYGQSVSLSFQQEELYKTSFGGFISIALLAIVISFFYSNIIDFFAMTSVSSNQGSFFDSNPSLLELTPKDFMFAVQIDQTNYTGNPYYNISVEQRHYKRFPNGTQVKQPSVYLDMVPCEYQHFGPIFQKYGVNFTSEFQKQNLVNFLCPNLTHPNSTKFLIGGQWSSEDYYFLKFSVTSCQQRTDNNFSWKPECKTEEEVNKIIDTYGSFRFQLFTTNFLVNPDDPKNYVQPYLAIDQFYTFAPQSMFIQSDIFVKGKSITTDRGILMYPDENTEVLAVRDQGDMRYQFEINKITPGYYAAFYLNRSPYSYTIQRSFLRLDQLLSYLGGFVQFMIVVMGVMVQFYNRQHFIISMANELYEFDKDPKRKTTITMKSIMMKSQHLKNMQTQGRSESVSKIQTIQAFSSKPDMKQYKLDPGKPDLLSPNISMKKDIKRASFMTEKFKEYFTIFKEYMRKQEKIGLTFRMVLSVLLPFESLMDDECFLIKKAMEQVVKELDIGFVINKLHEVSKLKTVLFNDSQEELFNFSHKPIIALINDRKRRSTKMYSLIKHDKGEVGLLKQFQALLDAYQSLINESNELSEEQFKFNSRLIILLGSELIKLLETVVLNCESSCDEPLPEDDEIVITSKR